MSKHNKKCCCTACCPTPIRPINFRRMPRITGPLLAGVALALLGNRLFQTPNINSNIIDINSDPDCEEDVECDCECKPEC